MILFKQHKESIFTVILIAIILLLHFLSVIKDFKILITITIAIISIYFGVLKLKIEKDKILKELFNEFNNRYNNKINDLFNKLTKKKTVRSKDLTVEDMNLIIDYINLCSEEYYWWKKGRIPNEIWNPWYSGIKYNVKILPVKEILINEISDKNIENSYYGLIDKLKNDNVI